MASGMELMLKSMRIDPNQILKSMGIDPNQILKSMGMDPNQIRITLMSAKDSIENELKNLHAKIDAVSAALLRVELKLETLDAAVLAQMPRPSEDEVMHELRSKFGNPIDSGLEFGIGALTTNGNHGDSNSGGSH